MFITHTIKQYLFNLKWRKNNKHNYTKANSIFPINSVKVGNFTYGELNVRLWNNSNSKLLIGNYCSIAENVYFLVSGEHNYKSLSCYPFLTRFKNTVEKRNISKGNIEIGDDVWIGINSTILSGVKIGQGAIVGAGSVVAKDIPPYAIFAGGKVIKYRFSDEIIKELVKFDYSTLTIQDIQNNFNFLDEDITAVNISSDFIKNHQIKEK